MLSIPVFVLLAWFYKSFIPALCIVYQFMGTSIKVHSLTNDKKGGTLAIGSFLRQVPFDSEHFETQSIKKPFGENKLNPELQ